MNHRVGHDLQPSSESSEEAERLSTMGEAALALSQPLTPADHTPTPPDPIEAHTRYLGVLTAENLVPTPDQPFVLDTLAEAHALLAAVIADEHIDVRERHAGGAIVEHRTRFGIQSGAELVLWRTSDVTADLEDRYPDLIVKAGPRGGIHHEAA